MLSSCSRSFTSQFKPNALLFHLTLWTLSSKSLSPSVGSPAGNGNYTSPLPPAAAAGSSLFSFHIINSVAHAATHWVCGKKGSITDTVQISELRLTSYPKIYPLSIIFLIKIRLQIINIGLNKGDLRYGLKGKTQEKSCLENHKLI